MKKLMLTVLAAAQFTSIAFAQPTAEIPTLASQETQPSVNMAETRSNALATGSSPYRTRTRVDLPITLLGVGASATGLYLIQENKHAPSAEELAAIDADLEAAKNKVNGFDRFGAGNFSMSAKKASDYPFYGSFALPFLLLLDKDVSSNAGQIAGLYVQTMAVTGTLFTMSVAHVERKRPLVYNNDPDNTERTKKHAQNSFFAGHTAAAASATFFAAKIFHDFNPDSKARPFVWGAAAAIPATVGYLRLKAGKHFLSDNLLGYAIGASAGILVPQLHKTKGLENVSIVPLMGPANGMAATVTF